MKSAGSRVRGEANNPATQHSHWFQFTSEENRKYLVQSIRIHIFRTVGQCFQLPLQESNIRASSRLLALGVLITADAGVVAGPQPRTPRWPLPSQCRWKLSVSRPQPNTDTVTVVTRPNTTTNYTTNNVTPAVVSCTDLFSVIWLPYWRRDDGDETIATWSLMFLRRLCEIYPQEIHVWK